MGGCPRKSSSENYRQNAQGIYLRKSPFLEKLSRKDFTKSVIKGTVMQIEKALINDRLRVSKVS